MCMLNPRLCHNPLLAFHWRLIRIRKALIPISTKANRPKKSLHNLSSTRIQIVKLPEESLYADPHCIRPFPATEPFLHKRVVTIFSHAWYGEIRLEKVFTKTFRACIGGHVSAKLNAIDEQATWSGITSEWPFFFVRMWSPIWRDREA